MGKLQKDTIVVYPEPHFHRHPQKRQRHAERVVLDRASFCTLGTQIRTESTVAWA